MSEIITDASAILVAMTAGALLTFLLSVSCMYIWKMPPRNAARIGFGIGAAYTSALIGYVILA